jgi:asparagine synthase (glutamine-hydrolysing)
MCGIAGFYGAEITDTQSRQVMERLYHRGPDDQQYTIRKDVGLIHTRLSIIELSPLGAQPYVFKNLVLVYNGELYNYKHVRAELEKLGYDFKSNSDTEVLIKAFHCWREKCVDRFIGMFAFAIYDQEADEILLFRDRLGVKPLYYSYTNGALFFASELKCLTTFPIQRTINIDAVALYFRFGFIPHNLSIYNSVSKLRPGHYLKVTRKGIEEKKYWSVNPVSTQDKTEKQWLDELEEVVISAFRYRMVSDVPVGVFLSGGIDSSLLTAILQKHYGNIHSFTIGFEETGFDESVYARQVAATLGTNHTEKILKLDEARGLLKKFYDIYDEPFADTSGIPTACVTKLAHDQGVKVVLSADGGDELFGGYTHYQHVLKLQNRFASIPSGMKDLLPKGLRSIVPPSLREKIFSFNAEHKLYALEEMVAAGNTQQFFEAYLANQTKSEIQNLIPGILVKDLNDISYGRDPLQTMMAWDLQYYLPDDLLVKVDRATMFYSAECREPFLDHRLVEFAMQVPNALKIKDGKGKYLLRELLKRYLPEKFFERKKQGFSIPIFNWFTRELDEMFAHYFTTEKLQATAFLNPNEVLKEYRKYQHYKSKGKQYNIEKMWRLLSFMLWWEKYMKP